jgi:hypothetical protein
MERNIIDITFKSARDFKARIAALWQHQKEDEIYNFIFLTDEVEKEFNKFVSIFENDVH